MTRLTKVFVPFLIINFLIIGCVHYDFSYLDEEHPLKQLGVKEQTNKTASAWFFLFMGGYSSETKHETKVKFAWFHPIEKTYIFTTFDIDRVRIKVDNFIEVPTVHFVAQRYMWKDDDLSEYKLKVSPNRDYNFITYEVSYVIITCREDQWNPKFDMAGL